MTLFEEIYENNKNIIEHIQSVLTEKLQEMPDNNYKEPDDDSFFNHIESHEKFEKILNNVKKELGIVYDDFKIWEVDSGIKLNSSIFIHLEHDFNIRNIIHQNVSIMFSLKDYNLKLSYNLYNDYNCSLSNISFKNKNGLCSLNIDRDMLEIKIPNLNTCYDIYKLENNEYTFREGGYDDFIFDDNFAQGKDSEKIDKTVKFLKFCLNDKFIKDTYLEYVFIDNVIKKKPIPQEIQDFFSLKYDKKIEDHSSLFSFNPLEKFNILKKENTLVSIFKKTIPTIFRKKR